MDNASVCVCVGGGGGGGGIFCFGESQQSRYGICNNIFSCSKARNHCQTVKKVRMEQLRGSYMQLQSNYYCFLGGGRIVLGVTVKHDSEVILDRLLENILHSLHSSQLLLLIH